MSRRDSIVPNRWCDNSGMNGLGKVECFVSSSVVSDNGLYFLLLRGCDAESSGFPLALALRMPFGLFCSDSSFPLPWVTRGKHHGPSWLSLTVSRADLTLSSVINSATAAAGENSWCCCCRFTTSFFFGSGICHVFSTALVETMCRNIVFPGNTCASSRERGMSMTTMVLSALLYSTLDSMSGSWIKPDERHYFRYCFVLYFGCQPSIFCGSSIWLSIVLSTRVAGEVTSNKRHLNLLFMTRFDRRCYTTRQSTAVPRRPRPTFPYPDNWWYIGV